VYVKKYRAFGARAPSKKFTAKAMFDRKTSREKIKTAIMNVFDLGTMTYSQGHCFFHHTKKAFNARKKGGKSAACHVFIVRSHFKYKASGWLIWIDH
jgi:hypothetical protein